VFTSINSTVQKFGQGVLQDGLEILLFDLGDMHRPTLKREEDMEFERGLSAKKILEILLSLKILITFSCVLTFETITS
jgi:hypothetical protein